MKIAIVLNTSWNIYNFRMNFVNQLLSQGYEVHTIAPQDDFTHYLIEAGCIHHKLKMDSRGANPIKDSGLIIELISIYRKIKPDVVLHYTIKPNVYGTLAAAFLNIPVVNNVCGLGTVFLKNNFISVLALILYRISFRFARKVFFQNPEDLQLFLDKNLIRKNQTDLLPGSGIDLQKFEPAPFHRNKVFTFLMISRLITDKGVVEFVEASRKLATKGVTARFQLLGAMDTKHKRGIKKSLIQGWINEGIVEYLGSTREVRPFIHQADCIVLPSYREGTPRTLLEAASSAKPIVATNVAGCRQVVEDRVNGLLCKIKDANDLAEKMEEMLNMENSMLKQFGEKGRQKMEAEFGDHQVIEKYMKEMGSLKKAS